jgi:hypothetical protein
MPGPIVFISSEVSVVHVFPDADAMGQHLQGVQERTGTAVEFIQTKGYEIYGSPSEPGLQAMRRFAHAEGVPLHVRGDHLGGYLRPGG